MKRPVNVPALNLCNTNLQKLQGSAKVIESARGARVHEGKSGPTRRCQTPGRPKKTVPKPFEFACDKRAGQRCRKSPEQNKPRTARKSEAAAPTHRQEVHPDQENIEFEMVPESFDQIVNGDGIPENAPCVGGRSTISKGPQFQVRFSLHAGSRGTKAVEGIGPAAQLREERRVQQSRKRSLDEDDCPKMHSPMKRRQSTEATASMNTSAKQQLLAGDSMDVEDREQEDWMSKMTTCLKFEEKQLALLQENQKLVRKEQESLQEIANLKQQNAKLFSTVNTQNVQIQDLKSTNMKLEAALTQAQAQAQQQDQMQTSMGSDSDSDDLPSPVAFSLEVNTTNTVEVLPVAIVDGATLLKQLREAIVRHNIKPFRVFTKIADPELGDTKVTHVSFKETINAVCNLDFTIFQKDSLWNYLNKNGYICADNSMKISAWGNVCNASHEF